MLIQTAMRLLAKHAEGPVEQVGEGHLRAVVNGRHVHVLHWEAGRVGRVVVAEVRQRTEDVPAVNVPYSGPSLYDGLRAALHNHRDEDVEAGGVVVCLAAEVTHGGVRLKPDLHFQVNGVVVSALQDREAFAMAEQFFQTGEGRPLLDWLQERSEEVATEVERVRRLAAR
jgi:hypothetical protein